jgi:hypothetical protein
MSDPEPQNLSEEQLLERAREAGLLARTPADWFDIYQSIVEHGVKTVLESAGEGGQVLDRLRPWRSDAKVVKREFQAHGLPLSDEVEIEGPLVIPDVNGFLTTVKWPRGLWVTFFWPDKSKLTFRGDKALVALGFIMWWSGFHLQYVAMQDPNSPKEQERRARAPKKRLIEPGSPEWDAYFAAKKRAQQQP